MKITAINKATAELKHLGLRMHRQAGMTLTESLLVLGIAAAVAVTAYAGYKMATSDVSASDLSNGNVAMVSKIKQVWGVAGDYSTVTAEGLIKAGVLPKSFKFNSTDSSITDNYGNAVTVSGAANKFAVLLGGPYDKDVCTKVASGLTGIAYSVYVGSDATISAGAASGTNNYKVGAAIDQSKLLAGCAADAKIAYEVR